jgi:hypothetical protein
MLLFIKILDHIIITSLQAQPYLFNDSKQIYMIYMVSFWRMRCFWIMSGANLLQPMWAYKHLVPTSADWWSFFFSFPFIRKLLRRKFHVRREVKSSSKWVGLTRRRGPARYVAGITILLIAVVSIINLLYLRDSETAILSMWAFCHPQQFSSPEISQHRVLLSTWCCIPFADILSCQYPTVDWHFRTNTCLNDSDNTWKSKWALENQSFLFRHLLLWCV